LPTARISGVWQSAHVVGASLGGMIGQVIHARHPRRKRPDHPSKAGRATAAAIPGAHLVTYPGMGHDLPKPLWPSILEEIQKLTRVHAPAERTPAQELTFDDPRLRLQPTDIASFKPVATRPRRLQNVI
jgi:hypothetical protein